MPVPGLTGIEWMPAGRGNRKTVLMFLALRVLEPVGAVSELGYDRLSQAPTIRGLYPTSRRRTFCKQIFGRLYGGSDHSAGQRLSHGQVKKPGVSKKLQGDRPGLGTSSVDRRRSSPGVPCSYSGNRGKGGGHQDRGHAGIGHGF